MHRDLEEEVDLFVERCESAWRDSDDVEIGEFLPPDGHPLHAEIAVELLRVDLDHRRSRGQNVDLDSYIQRFPKALSDPKQLTELAYEEYRLRLQAGESVDPNDYSSKYQVDTSGWKDAAAISTVGPSEDSLVEDHPSHDKKLQPGAAFEDFVLDRELGQGALARVFLARQTGIANRQVVLKFTSIQTVEIERLGKLQHSNIVPVLSVHKYANGAALCMPYLGETTLADVIAATRTGDWSGVPTAVSGEQGGAISKSVALRIAIGIAAGLKHAHRHDVIHGDLKPANILIATDGEPLLLDFNLAGDLNQLRPEVVGGTFRYMPPEHKLAFQTGDSSIRADVRSDIYSLGVVMQELLEGSQTPVSPALNAIVSKCTAREASVRYQTAEELHCDLTRQADNLPLRHQPEPSFKERVAKWIRRHPRLASNASLLTIFAIVVGIASIAWMSRSRQLDRANAHAEFERFQERVPQVASLLAVNQDGTGSIDAGLAGAEELLSRIEVDGSYRVSEWLDADSKRELRDSIGQLLFSSAQGHWFLANDSTSPQTAADELAAAAKYNASALKWFREEVKQVPIAVQRQSSRISGEPVSEALTAPADSSPLQVLLYATELNDSRRFEETCRYLDKFKGGFGNDVRFWTLLGSAHSGRAAHAKAEVCLTACLALNPESWFALTDRGLARLALKQFDSAEADFSEVVRLRPNYYGGYLNRALSRSGQRKFKEAIQDLDKVVELDGPTRAYFLRSRYRRVVGDNEGAAADFRQGLEAEPKDEASWVSRGVARMSRQPKEALEDFKRATKMNPFSVDGWRNIAHVLSERLNEPDASIEALGVIIDAGIEDAGAFAGRAVLHARAGRREPAIADIERALELDSEPMTRYQAACVFALLSTDDETIKARALSHLTSSINDLPRVLLGFADTDPDLKPIQNDPTYKKLMQASRTLYEVQRSASK